GRIAGYGLGGYFFLDPDAALVGVAAGFTGGAGVATATEIAAAVRAALPEGAVLLGFTPESVGTAVRRAIGRAADWRDFSWDLLHPPAVRPAVHLALDQVLTEEVGAGRRNPTLRIWEWDEPAVVIGSFQSLSNEVDLENARRFGVDVVRRISGGGAMFMEAGSVVTYSLYAPGELVAGMSFAESYAYLDDWVLQALRSLGIDATYQPLNDIASPLGKIGGAAQKRLGGGAVLHHVTMSYDMDGEKMVQVLRIGREKMSDKGTVSAAKRVDPLRKQSGLPRAAIIERMEETFVSLTGAAPGELRPEELARAEELVATKFATEEWLRRVP
ncbi:MAG: lipoate--protein ligase family protein, partial [Amnibacterium sp.]